MLLIAAPLMAQNQAPPLGMTAAVTQAVETDPSVTEALAQLLEQGEAVAVARSAYFPQVTVGTRSEFNSSLNRNVNVASVTASQLLYDFNKTGSAVDQASAGKQRRHAELLEAVDRVAEDTGNAVIEVQRNHALLAVAEDQVQGVSSLVELTRRRARDGAAARSDVRQAAARQDAAAVVRSEIASALADAMSRLRVYVPLDSPEVLDPDLPAPVARACATVGDEIDDLPRMQAARAVREEAKAQRDAARAAGLPTVSLDLRVDRFFDSALDDQTASSVLLNVRSDLFRGGANRAHQAAARYRQQAADAAGESVHIRARQVLDDARRTAADLQDRIATLERRIEHLAETRDLYRTQHLSLGTRSLLDLLNVEQEYHQARFDALNAVYDLRRIQVDCLASGGELRQAFALDTTRVQGVEVLP
ncbi:outer membrane efflux protein [Thioalkalivibrio nitratireducens DSM 14787]|uniref:Outer membrane efflux protein n=1 Tax=Thioalkalivibrio nitratireducens (strain DSM 14787 / UNIQEM 213 / ALEN2) TaxID=1255043 RepID=L0DX79_THIND|nr:TolC family protein [Thioalkalivibrio nitratireducens]AGA33653.1 outer membrane efflux protein [Thioalkalivibrio nitratireducens DSM 14787]